MPRTAPPAAEIAETPGPAPMRPEVPACPIGHGGVYAIGEDGSRAMLEAPTADPQPAAPPTPTE